MIHPTDYEIGVDEVGRGCLYGSVIAAAVVLPLDLSDKEWMEIQDSKVLSEKKRNRLADFIKQKALYYGIGEATHTEIDSTNILRSSIKAMHRAIRECQSKSVELNKPMFKKINVDGNYFIPYISNINTINENDNDETLVTIPYECIVKGDSKHISIAAASILAKTYRDNMILNECKLNDMLDRYDIQNNKGYGTKKHLEALKSLGPINGHRMTFKPIQK